MRYAPIGNASAVQLRAATRSAAVFVVQGCHVTIGSALLVKGDQSGVSSLIVAGRSNSPWVRNRMLLKAGPLSLPFIS